jgi:uncharacterized protein (TIGR00255 family)
MTGFGAAEGSVAGRHARVEVRSVNHRWFTLATRLPPELAGAEGELREAVRRGLDRGSVTVTVRWLDDAVSGELAVEWPRVDAVIAALEAVRERYGLEGALSIETVARCLDLGGARDRSGADLPWAAVADVVSEAVAACTTSRRREGEALTAELHMRLDLLEAAAGRIATAAPARLLRERERLGAAVAALMDGRPLDEARVAQELAHYADRVDITEELVRFRAHVVAARAALADGEPVGKRLGFLAQELGREVNTMGSKANDAAIAHEVIGMKSELEKVREQLENLA